MYRGMLLCTSIMIPKDITKIPIQAVACYCHGYSDHASYGKRIEYQRLVQAGIAIITIEYEGHGRSDGILGLIPKWDTLVNDVTTFFQQTITRNVLFRNKPIFLIGESMGGAVCYDVYNEIPTLFTGVVFICPMCKVQDDMLPPKWIINLLQYITGPSGTITQFGLLPIAPSKRLELISTRIPELMQHVKTSPTCFSSRKPRLITACQLLQTTKRISNSLSTFNAPFLVVHGLQDKVTDPKLSQLLYNESCATDKSIQLYNDLWHNMTTGETIDNMDMIFNDIISWILQRS
jgi:alpha-beta hydrolase superfamily lysophospholipase